MKRLVLASLHVLAVAWALALGGPRDDYPSTASRVLSTYEPREPSSGSGAARATAARAFLDALDDDQRALCRLALDDPARRDWTNVPPFGEQTGVRLGDLDEDALRRACDLLRACLSGRGWARTRDIVLADDELLTDGRPRPGFGAENFWLVLFGEPAAEGRWALQLDGHHLALNLTFAGDRVGLSPSFLGAQPARHRAGERVVEPLGDVAAAAFALVRSLDAAQLARAVVSERRGQLAAGAGRDGHVPEPVGLALEGLAPAGRERLVALLEAVVGNLPPDAAAARLAALESELDALTLAWRGPTADGSDVSWRLQGPSLILEYACQDLVGEPLQHLHSIYRDPTNEYGVRL